MRSGPATYSAWVDAMERFAAGDESATAELLDATFDWSPAVTRMAANRFALTLSARIDRAARKLDRDLETVEADPVRLAQALLAYRRRVGAALALCSIPALPEAFRASTRAIAEQTAAAIYPELEARFQAGRAAHELRPVIRQLTLEVSAAPRTIRARRPRKVIGV